MTEQEYISVEIIVRKGNQTLTLEIPKCYDYEFEPVFEGEEVYTLETWGPQFHTAGVPMFKQLVFKVRPQIDAETLTYGVYKVRTD